MENRDNALFRIAKKFIIAPIANHAIHAHVYHVTDGKPAGGANSMAGAAFCTRNPHDACALASPLCYLFLGVPNCRRASVLQALDAGYPWTIWVHAGCTIRLVFCRRCLGVWPRYDACQTDRVDRFGVGICHRHVGHAYDHIQSVSRGLSSCTCASRVHLVGLHVGIACQSTRGRRLQTRLIATVSERAHTLACRRALSMHTGAVTQWVQSILDDTNDGGVGWARSESDAVVMGNLINLVSAFGFRWPVAFLSFCIFSPPACLLARLARLLRLARLVRLA